MSGSGRTLRSRSRGGSIPKANNVVTIPVTPHKKFVSHEESSITRTSSKNISYDAPSYGENGIINKDSKEVINKSIKDIDIGGDFETIYDSGGIGGTMEVKDDGGGYSSDDSTGDSPWQNGQFKSPEEVLSYYKRFGDWWNYFPKTDYAYNHTSEWYGKEVAPGIPVIPNMARPPLYPVTPLNQYALSSFFKRKFAKDTVSMKSNGTASIPPSNSRIKNFFSNLITIVTTFIMTVWTSITSVTSIVSSQSNKNSHIKSVRFIQDESVAGEKNSWWNFLFGWLYRFSAWLLVQEVFIFYYMHQLFSKNKSRKRSRILKFLLFLLLPLLILLLVIYGRDIDSFHFPSFETIYKFQNTQ